MQRHPTHAIVLALFLALPAAPRALAHGEGEEHDHGEPAPLLLEAFNKAQDQPKRAAKFYRTVADHFADHDPLGRLARYMQGMAQLAAGEAPAKYTTALNALESIKLPGEDRGRVDLVLASLVPEMIALTRMALIKHHLDQHYAKHVRFPESLEALVSSRGLEASQLKDPWGNRFAYKAEARSFMPDVPRQKYTLSCEKLEAGPDALAARLEQWQAAIEGLRIDRAVAEGGQAVVRQRREDGTFGNPESWSLGKPKRGMVLLAVTDKLLIVQRGKTMRLLPLGLNSGP